MKKVIVEMKLNDESNIKTTVKLPWIAVIGLKIRKELNKTGFKVVFTPTAGTTEQKKSCNGQCD